MKIFNNLELQKRLINEFGLSLRQAQKTIKTYPIPYINESLEIIKHKIHQKLIKNIPAYTLTVLKNDFHPTIWDRQKQSILWDTQRGWREKQAQTKALKDFYSLKKEEQQKIIEAFEQEKIKSDILKTLYKREWVEGVVFKVMFSEYLYINK